MRSHMTWMKELNWNCNYHSCYMNAQRSPPIIRYNVLYAFELPPSNTIQWKLWLRSELLSDLLAMLLTLRHSNYIRVSVCLCSESTYLSILLTFIYSTYLDYYHLMNNIIVVGCCNGPHLASIVFVTIVLYHHLHLFAPVCTTSHVLYIPCSFSSWVEWLICNPGDEVSSLRYKHVRTQLCLKVQHTTVESSTYYFYMHVSAREYWRFSIFCKFAPLYSLLLTLCVCSFTPQQCMCIPLTKVCCRMIYTCNILPSSFHQSWRIHWQRQTKDLTRLHRSPALNTPALENCTLYIVHLTDKCIWKSKVYL